MIKTTVNMPDGSKLLILGLSGENMARLMSDEPIHIPYDKLVELLGDALTGLTEFSIAIIGGKDEETMRRDLEPYFGPNTEFIGDV